MATINLGRTSINYSIGSIIALVILILCVVFVVLGHTPSTLEYLALIGGLALALIT